MSIQNLASSRDNFYYFNTTIPKENRFIIRLKSHLENKIGDLALSIIAGASLTIGGSTFIIYATFIGCTTPCLVFSAFFLGIGAGVYFLSKSVKKYHVTKYLESYRKEAREMFKVFQYLDEIEYFDSKDIKKDFLRPLTFIAKEHGAFSRIFKHKLLDPDEFQKAFRLETNCMDFSETVSFYKKIWKEYSDVKDLYEGVSDYFFLDKGDWQLKLTEYLENDVFLDDLESPIDFDKLHTAEKVIDTIIDEIEFLFKLGIFKSENSDQITASLKAYQEKKEAFVEITEKFYERIQLKEDLLEKLIGKIKEVCQSQDSYKAIDRWKNDFLNCVRAGQEDWELVSNEYTRKLKILDLAYLPTGKNNGLAIENPRDKRLYLAEKQLLTEGLKEKEKIHKLDLQKEEVRLKAVLEKSLKNLESCSRKLEAENQMVVRDLSRSIQKAKEEFIRLYSEEIKEFRKTFLDVYEVVMNEITQKVTIRELGRKIKVKPSSANSRKESKVENKSSSKKKSTKTKTSSPLRRSLRNRK